MERAVRIRYQELTGKHTVTADGYNIGRVVDLVAEQRGDALRVTALLIGPSALVRRVGFKHDEFLRRAPAHRVPWALVAAIEDHAVRLRIRRADLDQAADGEEVIHDADEGVTTVGQKR